MLLRNSHTGSGSLWWKGAGWFILALSEQEGPESATDTKYVLTPGIYRHQGAGVCPVQ